MRENVNESSVSPSQANAAERPPEKYRLLCNNICCSVQTDPSPPAQTVPTRSSERSFDPVSVRAADTDLKSDKELSRVTISFGYSESCTLAGHDVQRGCRTVRSGGGGGCGRDHRTPTSVDSEFDLTTSCWCLTTLVAAAVAFSFVLGAHVVSWQMTPLLEDALKTCEEKKAEMTTTDRVCASSAMINGICSVYRFFAKIFN